VHGKGSLMAGRAPTTLLFAAFAVVTAYYARQAFLKQSKEISDQAELLKIQAAQLDENRKVNAEQIHVLKLEGAELQESLDQR
jgi:hypothetical protein